MTRSEAKLAGAKHYEGAPCRVCQATLRYLCNAACVACSKARGLTDGHRAATRKWYANNSAHHKILRDDWREDNREDVRIWNSEYRRERLGQHCAYTMAYNARKKKAIPPWADLEAIKKIYEACPARHQVDHIIPLRGKLVSGLHVESNLQYLPGVENNKKGNRYAA